jgi:hypothetical protein
MTQPGSKETQSGMPRVSRDDDVTRVSHNMWAHICGGRMMGLLLAAGGDAIGQTLQRCHRVVPFMYIYVFKYTSPCRPSHVCTYMSHTYIHIGTHAHTHSYIHTYIRMYAHAYIHTYTHTYIHTYTHTYTCTYVHALYQWMQASVMETPYLSLSAWP